MANLIEENFTDEEREQLEKDPELKKLLEQATNSDFPEPANRDSLLKFFRDILALDNDSFDKISRVGNLKDSEVGMLPLSARGYLSLGYYADVENLDLVAKYLRSQSNIVLNTSLSRAAKLLNLVVTQKKFTGTIEPKRVETKNSFFGSRTIESGGEE